MYEFTENYIDYKYIRIIDNTNDNNQMFLQKLVLFTVL